MEKRKSIIRNKNVKQYFNEGKRNEVRAIEIFHLIFIRETLLVGESGCGNLQLEKQLLN